jgi:hypothetical protein
MSTNQDQFVIDASGNKTGVLVDIERYSELLEAQYELESIRAYDEAKAANEESIDDCPSVRLFQTIAPQNTNDFVRIADWIALTH